MPTWNKRVGGNASNMQPGAMQDRAQNPVFKRLQVDSTLQTYAAADVIQLFDVPANSLVTFVTDVVTAEGGVATADLGWTEDPNGFDDALDLNVVTPQTGALAIPVTKLFRTASIITITLDHEINAAVLDFYVSIQTA